MHGSNVNSFFAHERLLSFSAFYERICVAQVIYTGNIHKYVVLLLYLTYICSQI